MIFQKGDRVALQRPGTSSWWGTIASIDVEGGAVTLDMDGPAEGRPGGQRTVRIDLVRPLFAVQEES